MELLTILLTGLLGLLSPVGVALEAIATNQIRSQLVSADELQVRIDNAPSHQVLQGRVQRLRLAGRGVVPVAGVRLAVLEVETDPIAVNPRQLRGGQVRLERPLQAGVRLVLTEADLNQALRSPFVTERLQSFSFALSPGQPQQRYRLVNPQVDLLPARTVDPLPAASRLRLQVALQSIGQPAAPGLLLQIETGLSVLGGRQVQLSQPSIIANGQAVPAALLQPLIDGINRQLDLQTLESSGVLARLLKLEVEDEQINLAAFVQVRPEALAARGDR